MNELMQQAIDDPTAEPGTLPPVSEMMGPPSVAGPAPGFTPTQREMGAGEAFDALRTRGTAALDEMNPFAASAASHQFVEDRNKRAALELQQASAMARASGGGGGGGGQGLTQTGIVPKTPDQQIATLVGERFNIFNTKEDPNAVQRAALMLNDDDKLLLVQRAQSDAALAWNIDKDQPAQAAALQDRAKADMVAALRMGYGMSGPDERGGWEKTMDRLVTGGGAAVAGAVDSLEGIDTVIGNMLGVSAADTDIGKAFFDFGESAGAGTASPQAIEGQRAIQQMVVSGRPISEIFSYMAQNPDVLASYGGNFVGQFTPVIGAGIIARVGAKAIGFGRAKAIIDSGALAEGAYVDAAAVQKLTAARKNLDTAIYGGGLLDDAAMARLAKNVEVAEAELVAATAKGARTMDVINKGGKADELLGAARGADAAASTAARQQLRKMLADDVMDTMVKLAAPSTAGMLMSAVGQYGMSMNEVRDSIMDDRRISDATLVAGPENRALFDKYVEEKMIENPSLSDEEIDKMATVAVRRDLVEAAQEAAFGKSLASAVMTGAPILANIPGLKNIFGGINTLERAAAGELASAAPAATMLGSTTLGGIRRGALFEGGQEFIQSGLEQMAANEAALTNPTIAREMNVRDENSGVLAQAAIGGVLGAGFGGAVGGVEGFRAPPPVAPAAVKDTLRGSTQQGGATIKGTQEPAAPAGGAGGAATATAKTETQTAQTAAAEVAVKGVTSELDDNTKIPSEFKTKLKNLFGYKGNVKLFTPSPRGSKPNSLLLSTFGTLWAGQEREDGGPLDLSSRDQVFAPFMQDGQLANTRLQELVGEIDAIADTHAPKQDTLQKNKRDAAMAAIESELNTILSAPKEAANVQATDQAGGSVPPDSTELGGQPGTTQPAGAGQPTEDGMQRVRNGASPDAVFTAEEIRARPEQPFAETPRTFTALVSGLGATIDGLRSPDIKSLGVPLLKAYNNALRKGVAPATAAKILLRMPTKRKGSKTATVTEARINATIEALMNEPGAPATAVGGVSEDVNLGKPQAPSTSTTSTTPTPQEDRTLNPTQAPTPGGAAEEALLSGSANDMPPPGAQRNAAIREYLNTLSIMHRTPFAVFTAKPSPAEIEAAMAALVAEGRMTRAQADSLMLRVGRSIRSGQYAKSVAIHFGPSVSGESSFVVFRGNARALDTKKGVLHAAMHETAGHAGLHGLVGGDKQLRRNILNTVARNKNVRELANALAKTWGFDVKTQDGWFSALEEAIAELAAVGFTKEGLKKLSAEYKTNLTTNISAKIDDSLLGVMNQVIKMVRDAWSAAVNRMVSDSEVRAMLSSMVGYSTSGAKVQAAMRAKLRKSIGAYGAAPLIVDHEGNITTVEPAGVPDDAQSMRDIPPDELNARTGDGFAGQKALDTVFPWDDIVKAAKKYKRGAWSYGSQLVEDLFNSKWGLLRDMEYIVANGNKGAFEGENSHLNFHLAAIRGEGISAQLNQNDLEGAINPTVDQLVELYKNSGLTSSISQAEFFTLASDYVMANHAKERNRTFYYEFEKLANAEANKARNKLLSQSRVNGMPTGEYMSQLRAIVDNGSPANKFSNGGTNYSGMTNDSADAVLAELAAKGFTPQIGEQVNEILETMRQLREQRALESGVFGQAGTNVQQTRGWKYYLPLRGKGVDGKVDNKKGEENQDDYEESPATIGGRGSYNLYGAEGRATKAANGIEALRNDVLLYGRRVGIRHYHSSLIQALDKYSDLLGVTIARLIYDPVAGMYKHEHSGQYIRDLSTFNKGSAKDGVLVVHSADAKYNGTNNDIKYIVRFPDEGIEGKPSLILKAIQADKQTALSPFVADTRIGGVAINDITGFMARAQTSLNPFWMLMTSWVRDVTGYPALLAARLGPEKGAKVASLYASHLAQNHLAGPMRVMFDGSKRRSLADIKRMAGVPGSWAGYYQRLMDLGGINSFNAQFESGMEEELNLRTEKKGPMSSAKAAFDRYSDMTGAWADGLEASHRVALFKSLLDAGYSEDAAAGLTKDLLNFQQVGKHGRNINAFLQFYKTSATSIDSMFRSFRKEDGSWDKKKAAELGGLLAMGGALLTIFSAGMMGDDDEGEPYANRVRADDWTKGIIVPTGDGSYRRVDIGLGFGGLTFGLGALAAGLAQGRLEPGEYAAGVFNVINRNAAPIQAAGVGKDATADEFAMAMLYGWATPSLLRPVVDIAANRNNFGGNIYQVPAFTSGKADAFSGRPTTPDFLKDITETLFKMTNGAIDIHPETIEYLNSNYLGSMARMGMTFVDIAHAEQTGTVSRKSAIDPFFLPGADTNRAWATDRMYNLASDMDLMVSRTAGGVASPADAASAEFESEINSIKKKHSTRMKDIRSNQLISADARRRMVQQAEADLNVQMRLLEDQIDAARASAR